MKNDILKSVLALVLIFAVFAGLTLGVNAFAAPLIEKNNSAAALAPLMAVMPEAKGFEQVYDAADPAASGLVNVPATVTGIYAETSGLGYAVKLSTTEGYTGEPMTLTFGVDASGKITGAQVDEYPDTKDMGEEYPLSYIGQDSAMPDVNLVAGVTYSSSAFKNAISDGFAALIENGLVKEGVKGEDQLLREQLPLVFPGMANNEAILQIAEEPTAAGGMLSTLGNGAAYIVPDGDHMVLVIVNAAGYPMAYSVDAGKIEADEALVAPLVEDAKAAMTDFSQSDAKAFGRMFPDATLTPVSLEGIYSSVTGAYLLQDGENSYLALSARSFGYSNMAIVTYYVLDENGAIVAMNADELILIKEYFSNYTLDEPAYKEGFVGLTKDGFTGEQAVISGATMSSRAVDTAVRDIFQAYDLLRPLVELGSAGEATENGGESNEG